MSVKDTIEARVARGAAWLDEDEPGWERRIDLASLDLANPNACVLCQVKGDFIGGLNRLPLDACASYGFTGPESELGSRFTDAEWDAWWLALDEAWIALIKERFASGLLSDEVSS